MKVAYSESSVVSSSGVQTTSAFGIARTPHMFNILSSGLYSDKVAAVIREIGCNAMDAHIMGGNPDLPFEVKLPTALDRSFYVKDWGPGLDDREVRELYTTYGWSSKQQSDDVTGAFGLGSKSPFAYTTQNEEDRDGFTIAASKDGVKRIYTCHIGDNGAPALSRLYEGPADADWPHGVMVTFPVQTRDIAEFHQKAAEVFRWFKVKPVVLGIPESRLETPDFGFKGSFFSMQAKQSDVESSGACVITGNVRYPINQRRLGDLSPTEVALLNSNVHFFLPIGEVMMTPSREELQYTEGTKANLRKALAQAALEVANRIREDVMTPEATRWAWYKKIQAYCDTLPRGVILGLEKFLVQSGLADEELKTVMQTVREQSATVPSWVGDGLAGPEKTYLRNEDGRLLRDSEGAPVEDPNSPTEGARVWIYTRTSEGVIRRREVLGGKIRNGTEYAEVKLNFVDNIKLLTNDGKQADARVRGALREGLLTSALLVSPCKGTSIEFVRTYAERIVKSRSLDGLPWDSVTTLPVPSSVELDKERRRLAREQGPRAVFADHEVGYLSLSGNVTTTTMGELDEVTDQFYLCHTTLGSPSKGTYRNRTEDYDYSFSGAYKTTVMTAVKKLVDALSLPVTGMIVVSGEGAVRRLKLAEQGFKPFFPWFLEKVNANPAYWESVAASVDRTPTVDLTNLWRADDYGWVGILAHHAKTESPFWKYFEAELFTSSIREVVLDFVAKADIANQQDDAPESALITALGTLRRRSSGLAEALPKISDERLSAYEVKNRFLELVPSFDALSETSMKNMMASDIENALAFLKFVLQKDGLVEGSSPRLQLAA